MSKAFLSLSLYTIGCLYASTAQAQVTSDGTVNTQVNQNGNVAEITGGETRGGNLFHSFQDFSVPTNNEAFFNNAESIANIFSRVTGGSVSNIDGLIRANGSASLFLINPAGIVFGQGARLGLGGSFYGSTASSILFEDGEFSAVDNIEQPILTINAPIGLGFRDNPAPIEVNSTAEADFDPMPFDDRLFGLRVPDGETFALAGGDITADGGGIVAVGGRIELGAVGESGTLGINFENDNLSFNFPDDLARANVSLTDNAGFLVSGNGGGDIAIAANNIEILEGSSLEAGIFGGLGSPDVQAGDLTLDASNLINIDRNSRVTNNVGNPNLGGVGNSGNIIVETEKLSISNGGLIGISTFGEGDTGNLFVNASESIEIDGFDNFISGIYADVLQNAIGNTGNITIETGQFSLSNGARISANAFGEGNTGNININTEQFNLSDGAQILTAVLGVGDSGNLTVNASESINISGIENNFGGLSAQLSETGRGNGGNVTLNTQIFNLNNNGQISASTFGEGRTGDIVITATESINIENSNLFSEVDQNATGNTGNIFLETGLLDINSSSIATTAFSEGDAANVEITSQNLIIQNGSFISTRTNGNGNGGSLNLNVLETIKIKNGSGLSFDTVGSGDGGNLTITTKNLLVEEGLIAGGTLSDGTGGTLTVNASESVELIATFGEGIPGGLTTQTQSAGQAGDLTVNTKSLIVRDGASVGANARLGSGDGGNLIINSENLLVENAQIGASTFSSGDAGNLNVVASESIELIGTDEGLGENPSGIFAQANIGASGNSGSLTVETKRLSARDGGQVSVTSLGTGNAGDLSIIASESVELVGTPANNTELSSGLFADTQVAGNAGDLTVTTEQLIVRDGAEISANSIGEGTGGNLFLQANSLTLDGQASIGAETESNEGGNILLQIADSLILRDNSSINAQAFGEADGGNLNIDARYVIAFPSNGTGNDLVATADRGTGGNIDLLDVEGIFGLQPGDAVAADNQFIENGTNDIDASSNVEGFDGTISIDPSSFTAFRGVTELPTNIVVPEQTVAQACRTDRERLAQGGFTISGKGGIVPNPSSPLDTLNVYVDGEDTKTDIPEALETSQGKIQPARGVRVTDKGIMLTAYRTNNAGDRLPESNSSCDLQ